MKKYFIFLFLSIFALVGCENFENKNDVEKESESEVSTTGLTPETDRTQLWPAGESFTAIIMLLISPQALFDVGFQMSFMAVFSILLFVPLFYRPFSAEYLMTHRIISWLWGMIAVSIAAQIGVAPLIAYYFGRFSCYFLLTNFIVIPAATLILYLSLGTLLIPSIGVALAGIVGLLNTTLLYIATIPGATIEGLHPSVILTASIYGIIFATYYLLWLTIPKAD